MSATENSLPVSIWHCCRDWPVIMPSLVGMGRCGYCCEVPEPTDKTVEQYMRERRNP